MKYTFRATGTRPTHVRTSDNAQGVLREFADTVNTWGRPLVDPAGYSPIPLPPIPLRVPVEIANWRARAVLEIAGLLATVETALDALPGNDGIIARAAWSSGAALVRTGPTVIALAAALALAPEEVDALFVQAAALEV